MSKMRVAGSKSHGPFSLCCCVTWGLHNQLARTFLHFEIVVVVWMIWETCEACIGLDDVWRGGFQGIPFGSDAVKSETPKSL